MQKKLSVLIFISCLAACGKNPSPENSAANAPSTATTKFEMLPPERSGIKFAFTVAEDYRYNFIMDPYIYNGGGVAVLDFDNDGLQDLFFTARLQGCRLYRNLGGLKFEDVSEKSGVAKEGGLKTGVTTVDINADGWMDLYVCRTWLQPLPERRNLLFINNKNGTFSNQASAFGLDDISPSQQANFFDFDLDGDLDCYLMNHPVDFKNISNLDFLPSPTVKFARNQPPKDEFESDKLYRNDGGKFADVSKSMGINNRAYGLSVLTPDIDDDGFPDVYIGNDFIMPDFFYLNPGKSGRQFSDKADQVFRHTSTHSMGADFADLNADGLPDLVTLDMLAADWPHRKRLMTSNLRERDKKMNQLGYGRQVMRNTLQFNNGKTPGGHFPTFSEAGCLAGIFATDWSWAPLANDYDNDGRPDIFISNGIKRDLNDMDFFLYTADSMNHAGGIDPKRIPNFEDFAKKMPSVPVHNYMFQNIGSQQFTDVSAAWGFTKNGFSNGAAYADLDNDGDLDLITNNLEEPARIYENKAVGHNQNNWLQVRCQGPAQNPMGLGAKLRAFSGGELLFSGEMLNVRGYYSSVEPVWQIGLGSRKTVDRLEIEWPGGKVQILEQVAGNQRLTLKIEDAKPGKLPPLPLPGKSIFQEISGDETLNFRHKENAFDDFDRERLLPHQFSRTGPCLAVGDVNGDKLDDVFIGGASGQIGAIFVQNKNGNFAQLPQNQFVADAQCEDTDAAFFDFENDGDLDLYVVSGGNEQPAGSPVYQDRLYLNSGKGVFSKAENVLPAESESGACVAAHDFDGDGDLDLFVGSQVVPGRFPEFPGSLILKNGSAGGASKFEKITPEVAPEFQRIGLTTDLKFADLNADGKPELIVAGEWMPITVFEFDGKTFKNATQKFGLENTSGWWNCLEINDLDGDGDLDIAAGNLGLNTRFRTSPREPMKLFAADFDKNGSLDPIMAFPEKGGYFPVAMRDELAVQILSIMKKKFPRHSAFSTARVSDIFPEKDLQAAQTLDAKVFETMWFENSGEGKFVARKLPLDAQLAPTQCIISNDFNADGKIDLLTLGNDNGHQTETNRLDASNGCLLLGDGAGNFRPVAARFSGLWAGGEARDGAVLALGNGKKLLVVSNCDAEVQVFLII